MDISLFVCAAVGELEASFFVGVELLVEVEAAAAALDFGAAVKSLTTSCRIAESSNDEPHSKHRDKAKKKN